MKITLNYTSDKLEQGDLVVFEGKNGETKSFIVGQDERTVFLFSIDEGKIAYSIAAQRGFNELIAHAHSFINENFEVNEVHCVKKQNVEIIVNI